MKRKQYKVSEAQIPMFDFDHPHMPVLDVSRCEARLINYETAARMVETYHYAHRVPSIVVAVGMFVDGMIAGTLTYGMPSSSKTKIAVCGEDHSDIVIELNRLYIHGWCGRNSESWLIGQSFDLLPSPSILVSFADIGQCHLGYIYQATNWIYTGLSDDSGAFSRIEVNGTERTSKSFYDELGTQSKEVILKRYPDAIFHEYTRKHRYVYFLGNKRQRRILRQALKWPVLPYPKGKQNEIGL